MTAAPLSYRIALWLTSPLLAAYTLHTARKAGGARYFWQRLGWRIPPHDGRPVWFHCASVGEVEAAAPLIHRWRAHDPEQSLMVTTVTPTGAETAARRLPNDVRHCYLPLDWPGAVARFLQRNKPRYAVILETELWPSLYAACAQRDIALVMVNARLSERTLNANRWARGVYARTLQHVSAILTRSDADRQKFLTLGAAQDKVRSVGNLKFAGKPGGGDQDNLIGRPYWLAASTHDDEELQLAQVCRQLGADTPMLVIAPRHPRRKDAICAQLKPLGLPMAIRSEGDPINADTRIYLADTLGEMSSLMVHAQLVFMGGSLAPVGGHNLLEPARLQKAILIGPHVRNVADEVESLHAAGGLQMVENDEQLLAALEALLASKEQRETMGNAAHQFTIQHACIADEYLQQLTNICEQVRPGERKVR